MVRLRRAAAPLLLFVISLVVPSSAHAQTTAVVFESEAGDHVGRGLNQTWTSATATFNGWMPAPSQVTFSITSGADFINLKLGAPAGTALSPGVYESAQLANYGAPQLDVSASGRWCSRTGGRFAILEIETDISGAIVRFAADFEQHCFNADAALLGAIRFNSTVESLTPFGGLPREISLTVVAPVHGTVSAPGISCATGMTDCGEGYTAATSVQLTATPDPGYQFLGWLGDCDGTGSPVTIRVNRRMTCTAWFGASGGSGNPDVPLLGEAIVYIDAPANASRRTLLRSGAGSLGRATSANAGEIEVLFQEAKDGDQFRFVFKAPDGSALAPAAYEYATRYPFQSPLFPGLDVTIRSSGCNTLRGRFVIYELAVADGAIQRLAVDFEHHCEGAEAALFGAIRFNSDRSTLIPFDGAYPSYELQVRAERGGRITATGIDCGDDCAEAYFTPTVVTLTAVPDAGFAFAGWAEDCTGAAVTTIAVNQRRRCTAIFSPTVGTDAEALEVDTLLFDSYPGDYVGGGERAVWTGRSSIFSVVAATEAVISFEVITPTGARWSLNFAAPAGTQLRAGNTYEGATRYAAYAPGAVPGLDVFGHGRSCGTGGRFDIHELSFDTQGVLTSLSVDFEQQCGTSTLGLFGSLRFNATRARIIPFDGAYPSFQLEVRAERGGKILATGIDCGADCAETFAEPTVVTLTAIADEGFRFAGWADGCSGAETTSIGVDRRRQCTAIFSPLEGHAAEPLALDMMLIDSDPEDGIGRGRRMIWTNRTSVFSVQSATLGVVNMRVRGPDGEHWNLDFAAPAGEVLTAGRAYDFATDYPAQRASDSALNVSNHTVCSTGRGRFAVHEITFEPGGQLSAFAADFEQSCNAGLFTLRGSIRYHSTYAAVVPYPTQSQTRLLFHHTNTGELIWWLLSGGTRLTHYTPYPGRVGANWRIAGVAEINGDNRPDILFQEKDTGDLFVWFLGYYHDRSGYGYLSIPRPADPLWKVVGLGDMNGDEKPDLVWQHSMTGALASWFLNGTTVIDRVGLNPGGVVDTGWKVVATGDFNGDGKTDLLWKHSTDGYLIAWLMDGITRTSVEWLTPHQLLDNEWQVAATGDLNADGKTDIIFQHSDGRLATWLMDGVVRMRAETLNPGAVADPAWKIAGAK